MGHQYYKIISLHGKKHIVEKTEQGLKIKDNVELGKDSKTNHWYFQYVLNRCLDTDYLLTLCKQKQYKHIQHPTKLSEDLFLGYSEAFIMVHLTKDVRELLYTHGFTCNGHRYVRYKRSASSAKNRKCLFIREELKNAMDDWSRCGLDFSQGNESELTSWEAYTALTLSGIQETFTIPKKSILLIKDYKSVFDTSGICVRLDTSSGIEQLTSLTETNEDTETYEKTEVATIENTIWDGQCLIDESVFETLSADFSSKHMLLLRNRFFKSCGFKTKLQKWFQDNGTTLSKLNGYTTATNISDIKIVITESSLKFLKFYKDDKNDAQYLKKALKAWFSGLDSSHSLTFGIVKGDTPSRYWNGEMVRTNYQLLNTLGLNNAEVAELLKPTFDYIEKAQSDALFFKHFIKHGLSFSIKQDPASELGINAETSIEDTEDNSTEEPLEGLCYYKENMVEELLYLSDMAFQTKICKDVRNRRIEEVKKNVSRGRFLIPGTYATLFGNPIEFLFAIIDKKYQLPETPTTVTVRINEKTIQYPTLSGNQIYSTMFADTSKLCGARSPHITMGNLFLCQNTHLLNEKGNSFIAEYFDLSPQIVCVNSIGFNLLQMLNGADFDSDTMLITNQPLIVKAVKRQRDLFPVPINKVDGSIATRNTTYFYNENERNALLVEIDNKIGNNIIGQIVNYSQLLNSILWTRFPNLCVDNYSTNDLAKIDLKSFESDYLYNAICELEVLSNIEIDKAKRCSLSNPATEFARISNDAFVYQLSPTPKGEFVAQNIPPYLIAARNSKWTKATPSENDQDSTVWWNGISFSKSGEANHQTTLSYIYSSVKDTLSSAPKDGTLPFSSLVEPVSGSRSHADIFNKIKILCAYYYLKIRTSYISTTTGLRRPDYQKCSEYVSQCFKNVEKGLQASDDIEFVIFSLIEELDESNRDGTSAFIVNNTYNQIKARSPVGQAKYAKSTHLIQLVEKLVEYNNKREKPKEKFVIHEYYGDLLLTALFNAKDKYGTYPLREMIKRKQTTPVQYLHYNESKGKDYIYNYRFERKTVSQSSNSVPTSFSEKEH